MKVQSNQPLNLITIVNQNLCHEVNPFVKALYDDFIIEIQKFPKEEQNEFLFFQDFMAFQFSKEVDCHLNYQISSIFTEIKCNQANIDGILYPSFRMDGKGVNVAIKPDSMKKLNLVAVGEFNVYKKGDKTVVGNCASLELDGKTEIFEMNEDETELQECLNQLRVNSIEDLYI